MGVFLHSLQSQWAPYRLENCEISLCHYTLGPVPAIHSTAYLYKNIIWCPLFNVKFYENYFTFLINASTLNVWIQNCVGNIVGDHNTSTNVELYFMIRLWLKPWQPEYCLGECELLWIHLIRDVVIRCLEGSWGVTRVQGAVCADNLQWLTLCVGLLCGVGNETWSCAITEKGPTRAFSWLIVAATAFTFENLC